MLLSTVHFDKLTVNHKSKDTFIGPFTVVKLVGTNTLELELHGAYVQRHPVFPVSLIKIYKESDINNFTQWASKEKKLLPEIEEKRRIISKVI